MMWGPGVSKAAADLALDGATDVVDVTDLGLDRFDEHGRSRLAADPIALPVPRVRFLIDSPPRESWFRMPRS